MSDRLTRGEFRELLLDLLARAVPFVDDAADDAETGVPTAVLVVLEWQGADGGRWLALDSCLGSAQAAPDWTERMLAVEAFGWDTHDDVEVDADVDVDDDDPRG